MGYLPDRGALFGSWLGADSVLLLPAMLLWLAASILPAFIARWSRQHARRVPWGAIDLVAEAARRIGLSSNGLSLPRLLLRTAMLCLVAVAAARPFLPATLWPASSSSYATKSKGFLSGSIGQKADASATRESLVLVPGNRDRCIELIVADSDGADAGHPGIADRLPAVARAITALAGSDGLTNWDSSKRNATTVAGTFPTVAAVSISAAAQGLLCGQSRAGTATDLAGEVFILCDGVIPTTDEAARLSDAVEHGASLLVLVGPTTLASVDSRQLSQWLESLVGISIEGTAMCDGSRIEVDSSLAEAAVAKRGAASGSGSTLAWSPLPGPSVMACAELFEMAGSGREGKSTAKGRVLARAFPAGRPLLIESQVGRGRVVISGLPLSLPHAVSPSLLTTADAAVTLNAEPWSDLAAWPVFVPLIDRLLDRLLTPANEEPLPHLSEHPDKPLPSQKRSPRNLLDGWPLAAVLLGSAIALALLEQFGVGPPTGRGSLLAQALIFGCLLVMLLAWSGRPEEPLKQQSSVAPEIPDRPRSVAVLVDISPSMATEDIFVDGLPPATAKTPTGQERLKAALDALLNENVLPQIAGQREVSISTIGSQLLPLGRLSAEGRLPAITTIPPAVLASRQGDAIVQTITAATSPLAAVIIASDGAITAGASWSQAARFAAGRSTPIIAVPVGAGGTLKANDDLATAIVSLSFTAATLPRLCWRGEEVAIVVRATSLSRTTTKIPLAFIARNGRVEAEGWLRLETPDGDDGVAESELVSYRGEILWTPSTPGPQAMLLVAGHAADASPDTADCATVFTRVIDDPLRVLLIDAVPRFEFRFLEQLLAGDPHYQVTSCLLEATPAMRSQAPLPTTVAEWNQFDVVVLGDMLLEGSGLEISNLEGGGEKIAAVMSLRAAAADNGIGVAWSPGHRVRRLSQLGKVSEASQLSQTSDAANWLPVVPLATDSAAADLLPRHLRIVPSALESGWFRDARARPLDFKPVVFDLLSPVRLRPTARILAVSQVRRPLLEASLGGDFSVEKLQPELPAIVVDQWGSATMLVHLCETWRWRENDGQKMYADYWRAALMRLAETHMLARLSPATLELRPLKPRQGQSLLIDVSSTRRGEGPAGWFVEHVSPQNIRSRFSIHDKARTVRLEQVLPGWQTLRLFAAQADSEPAIGLDTRPIESRDFFVSAAGSLAGGQLILEQPGSPARIGAMQAAAALSGGSVVTLGQTSSLADALIQIDNQRLKRERASKKLTVAAKVRQFLSSVTAANLLLLILVLACGIDWSLRAAREPR